MSKPKVLITVEGGIVQSVDASTDIDIVIVDYDDHADDPVVIVGPNKPDNIFKEGEAHTLLDHPEYPLSAEERLVRIFLRKQKF